MRMVSGSGSGSGMRVGRRFLVAAAMVSVLTCLVAG